MFEREVHKAAKKFKAEFNFSKMDTMIHRFPPGLREISSRYPSMVVPRFVAIGPYHHGKKHLEKMEAVKKAAAHYLCQRSKKLEQAVKKAAAHYLCQRKRSEILALDDATKEVLVAVDEARGKYFADETVTEQGMMKDDAHFADIMLCDACFLLHYMDAYNRSYSEYEEYYEVNESMRRFLFSNRDIINNDIMLLENQLPWLVIEVLMHLGSDLKLKEAVGYFIAAMGSSFKIRESSELKPYVWEDEKNPPAHLLALLRRQKIEEPDKMIHSAEPGGSSTSDDDVENNNNHRPPRSNPLHHPLLTQQAPTPPPTSTTVIIFVSAISPMELEEIGIELTASPTAAFSDMGLEKGRLFFRHLTLAPLSLSDTRASWLVNMVAFEVCTTSSFGDQVQRTDVCSYLTLLAFFMVGSEDVHRLRKKGLLHGRHHSDDDMLAFFKTVVKHLPDCGKRFSFVMAQIEEYRKNSPIRNALYKWLYNNYGNIIKVATGLATLIGLYQAFLSLILKK